MKTLAAAPLLAFVMCFSPAAATGQIVDDLPRQQARLHYRNGQELIFAEQFEKAAGEFMKAINLDPLLTLAHYGLGQSYMAQKRYASAVQAFIGCREAYHRIFALRQSNRIASDRMAEDEIRELRDAISMFRGGRVKGYSTGESKIAQLEARVDELERMRQMPVDRPQTPAEVSLALGSAYFRNGDLPDAEREWKAAVSVNDRLGEAHNNLAVVYMMAGRKREAEEAVRAAERAGFRVHPLLKEDIRKIQS